MNSSIEVDRLSVLPVNITDSILTRLPIFEAVRTSILSRSWRYQWHSLSEINLNPCGLLQVSQIVFDNKTVKIIDHILLLHRGSVDKFKLDIYLETCNDIDRWILYVSRNGIKELIINKWSGEFYNIPSCLFSCSDLTYLKLLKCIYKPPPAAFKAFSNLTELSLVLVKINREELENLLNSCPLLSRLTCSCSCSWYHCPTLKINAPNLVMIDIEDFYCYIQFKNTSLLADASFGLEVPLYPSTEENEDCKIVELLGSMPSLRRLEFSFKTLRHMAVGDVPARLPLICPIKQLILWINFEDLQELLAAFCIFRSSPFLQQLDVTVNWDDPDEDTSDEDTSRLSADGFWKGEHDFSFRFDHLQTVMVTLFKGTEYELKFIEFLLSNAPALRTMNIHFDEDVEDVLTIVRKLIRFPRISPEAELILPSI